MPFPIQKSLYARGEATSEMKRYFSERFALVKSTYLTVSLISAVTVLSRWNKVSSDEAVALISRDI